MIDPDRIAAIAALIVLSKSDKLNGLGEWSIDGVAILVGSLGYLPCDAIAKSTGKRCTRRPKPEMTCCKHHGGAAPQTIARADERRRAKLEAMVDPSLKLIEDIIKEGATGSNVAVGMKGALSVLDRAGFPVRRELTGANGAPLAGPGFEFNLEILTTDEKQMLAYLLERTGVTPANGAVTNPPACWNPVSTPAASLVSVYRPAVERSHVLDGTLHEDWANKQLTTNDPPAIEASSADFHVV